MIKLKRAGFTLIELVISMILVACVTTIIFYIPRDLIKVKAMIDESQEFSSTYHLLQEAIQKDISKGNDEVIIHNSQELSINGNIYEFVEEGVYRTYNSKRIKLTSKKVNYEIVENTLRIFTEEDNNNNKMDVKYNLSFTTIPKGRN